MSKLPSTAFQPGCAPGPGRPKGSRTRLQEFVLAMFTEDFREHGHEVIQRVREKHPQTYLMAAVGLLPKQTQKLESPFADLSDAELEQLERYLVASRAQSVQQIDSTAVAVKPAADKPSEH